MSFWEGLHRVGGATDMWWPQVRDQTSRQLWQISPTVKLSPGLLILEANKMALLRKQHNKSYLGCEGCVTCTCLCASVWVGVFHAWVLWISACLCTYGGSEVLLGHPVWQGNYVKPSPLMSVQAAQRDLLLWAAGLVATTFLGSTIILVTFAIRVAVKFCSFCFILHANDELAPGSNAHGNLTLCVANGWEAYRSWAPI